MAHPLSDRAAIVGIGATEFSKNSGRSELQLAVEAISTALNEAGLSPKDVDGLSTFTIDNNNEYEVGRALGCGDLTFFSRIAFGGGGACAPLHQAAMAVATGAAEVIVCYRAMNERSEYRFGAPMTANFPNPENLLFAYHAVHGLSTAAAMTALAMRSYMKWSGATSEDFANVAIGARRHAANNPAAFFYGKPISRDDYMAGRMIAEPFRLFDCCQESDGAVAIVVTSAERARDLRQKPVLIRGAAQGASAGMVSVVNYYREDPSPIEEVQLVGRQLYAMSGLTPGDIQSAVIYDHFGPTVLCSLEALGFCERGEAKDFIRGGNIEVGGKLPVNTHGGQVGEAYIHGMNGIAEAVRQVRGTAVNQVQGLNNVLVTAGSAVPTSGLILGR